MMKVLVAIFALAFATPALAQCEGGVCRAVPRARVEVEVKRPGMKVEVDVQRDKESVKHPVLRAVGKAAKKIL